MVGIIKNILNDIDLEPVLFEVGASGEREKMWDEIAGHSIHVSFDPDLREIREVKGSKYKRAITINKAVIAEEGKDKIKFFFTKSPYCSSTLRPDLDSLSNYTYVDLFNIESEADVEAVTLDAVIKQNGISHIDWLKLDTQGTDLRIVKSLDANAFSKMLAVDIEPGWINAYKGEDLFVDAHKFLLEKGFWLSDIKVKGAVRIRQKTLDVTSLFGQKNDKKVIDRAIRKTPAWCEAKYLRSIESLGKCSAEKKDYVLLWVFAVMQNQLGFALDVIVTLQEKFDFCETIEKMKKVNIGLLNTRSRSYTGRIINLLCGFLDKMR